MISCYCVAKMLNIYLSVFLNGLWSSITEIFFKTNNRYLLSFEHDISFKISVSHQLFTHTDLVNNKCNLISHPCIDFLYTNNELYGTI